MIVHDKHPDIEAYDKLVGIDDIVMGDEQEPVDPGAEARRKRQLLARACEAGGEGEGGTRRRPRTQPRHPRAHEGNAGEGVRRTQGEEAEDDRLRTARR